MIYIYCLKMQKYKKVEMKKQNIYYLCKN